jgi:hypothetical protein
MDFQQLWQRYEDWLYYHDGLGLYLDISRISFDDALVEKLKPKFTQAFQDMAALEGGAIANPDENRRVGHYWLRNPDLAPPELQQEIVETLGRVINQQFQIQNVAKDTKSLRCLRSRGLMPIFRISVMLYLVIDQVCLQVTDSLRDRDSRRECKKTQRLGQYLLHP